MNKDQREELLAEIYNTTTTQEWMDIAESNRELFPDPWEMSDWGFTLHPRCIGHWVGIQMATGNTEAMLKRYEI